MRYPAILLLVVLLAASGCRRVLPEIGLLSDPDAYMTFRVAWYFTDEMKIKVNQFQFIDAFGATSAARLIEEYAYPRAHRYHPNVDVYWSGDPVYCEILSQRGLTIAYRPESLIPDAYRDPADHWTGFAARARVLLVPSSMRLADRPASIRVFADPAWAGRGAMTDPLRGTSRSLFAALGILWGDQGLADFYAAVRKNGTRITLSDDESADLLVNGKVDVALVDTDVALIRIRKNQPVDIIYPDQDHGEAGVMVIPNAVTIMRGCKDFAAASRFVDFLASPDGERRAVSFSPSQVPLQLGVAAISSRIWRVESLHVMRIDYAAAARKLPDMEKILAVASNGQVDSKSQ